MMTKWVHKRTLLCSFMAAWDFIFNCKFASHLNSSGQAQSALSSTLFPTGIRARAGLSQSSVFISTVWHMLGYGKDISEEAWSKHTYLYTQRQTGKSWASELSAQGTRWGGIMNLRYSWRGWVPGNLLRGLFLRGILLSWRNLIICLILFYQSFYFTCIWVNSM